MNKEIDVINEREIVNEYANSIINEFWRRLDKNSISIDEQNNHLTKYYQELVLLRNQLFSSSYDNQESILKILEQFKAADEYIKVI